MKELQLHDIKTIVAIDDTSIYYFYGTVVGAVVVCAIVLYLLIKYLRKEKAKDMQKVYLEELNATGLDNAKEAAYRLTEFGALLDKDAPQREAYDSMLERLEAFKYKKEVGSLDPQTHKAITKFVDLMNE